MTLTASQLDIKRNTSMLTSAEVAQIPAVRNLIAKCEQEIKLATDMDVALSLDLKKNHLPTSDLASIIADVCEVPWHQILSASRKRDVVIARQLFCWFAIQVQKQTLLSIGETIGRDHTTVIHAREAVKNMLFTKEPRFMYCYTGAKQRLLNLLVPGIDLA